MAEPSLKFTPASVLSIFAGIGVFYVAFLVAPEHVANGYVAVKKIHPIAGKMYLLFAGGFLASLTGLFLWLGWSLAKKSRLRARVQRESLTRPSEMSLADREREMARHLESVEKVLSEADPADARPLRKLQEELHDKQTASRLEIVVVGTISSGKSSLLNALSGRAVFASDVRGGTTTIPADIPWKEERNIHLVDTPGLGEITGDHRGDLALEAAKSADIVLFIVDGPLKDHEHRVLKMLHGIDKPIVLCLNKADWISEEEKARLLKQLRTQTQGLLKAEKVVAVRSEEVGYERTRILADGREEQEKVVLPPDISDLAKQLLDIVHEEGQNLLLCNLLLRSRILSRDAEAIVAEARDERARAMVSSAMWKTGGLAAAAPLPLLDAAVSVVMHSELASRLAGVYRQPFDWRAVQRLLENLIKNLAVTLSIPLAAATLASAAKMVPGIGTLAGAALQGAAQALFTRWLGLVLIEYYRSGCTLSKEALAEKARRTWTEIVSDGTVRALIDHARQIRQTEGEK